MNYDILINTEIEPRRYLEGYVEGDELVLTFSGQLLSGGAIAPALALEQIWVKHNRDDRPDGKVGPSLSVGDVVHLCGDGYHACRTTGWQEITAPDSIENEETWLTVMARKHP